MGFSPVPNPLSPKISVKDCLTLTSLSKLHYCSGFGIWSSGFWDTFRGGNAGVFNII